MAQKKNKKRGNRKLSRRQVQSILYGPRQAELRRRTTKKQFQRIKRQARRRGVTVEGLISGAPQPLKERSKKGIRRQAKRTVTQAYKPVLADLNQADQRVRALDEKRATDLEHWRNWLKGESDKMLTASRTADERLQQDQENIQKDLAGIWSTAQEQAKANVQQETGYVSDPEQSNALDFSPEQQRDLQKIAAARTRTNEMIGTQQEGLARTSANNFAFMAAQDAKRISDTWNALKDVADERTKVKLTRAADMAGEVSRLFDQEIDKAQSNREFSAALQKLGLDRAEFKFERKESNRAHKLAKRELKRKITNDQLDHRIAQINAQLRSGELGEKRRSALARERNQLRTIRETRRHNRKTERQKDREDKKGGRLSDAKILSYKDKYEGVRSKMKVMGPGGASVVMNMEGVPDLMIQAAREAATGGMRSATIRRFKKRFGFIPKGRRHPEAQSIKYGPTNPSKPRKPRNKKRK